MQTLDVISINLWQMLVSLANLVLLFLAVKKFLYKPIKKMLATRQESIDKQYSDAEKAKAKEEKKKAKERERKRKALEAAARQAERDAMILEEYIRKYRQEKESAGKKKGS